MKRWLGMKLTLKKENILKYLLIAVFFSVTFCFAFKSFAVKSKSQALWNFGYSDIGGWWLNGRTPKEMPYINQKIEYPVIIGMIMYISGRGGTYFYLIFHYLLFLAAALVSTFYLYRLSEKINSKKISIFIFWALAPTMFWFSYYNWDIVTVMFSVLALYFYHEKKDVLATVFLSLGFATKMYPILFLFPVVLHRRFKEWFRIGITFVATFFLVNIYFIIKNFENWSYIYTFHTARPPNPDTVWYWIGQVFPSLTVKQLNNITMILFALLYVFINLKYRERGFIFLSYVSVLLFLIINKVFSPQFLLWLLPFFALFGEKLILFYSLEISNILVLFTTLGHIFSRKEFTAALVYSGIFVVIRHLMLIVILLGSLRLIRKWKVSSLS